MNCFLCSAVIVDLLRVKFKTCFIEHGRFGRLRIFINWKQIRAHAHTTLHNARTVNITTPTHKCTYITNWFDGLVLFNALQSCLVYPHTLVTQRFGWFKEPCRLLKHHIIDHFIILGNKYVMFHNISIALLLYWSPVTERTLNKEQTMQRWRQSNQRDLSLSHIWGMVWSKPNQNHNYYSVVRLAGS